jgi:hypothetical protein
MNSSYYPECETDTTRLTKSAQQKEVFRACMERFGSTITEFNNVPHRQPSNKILIDSPIENLGDASRSTARRYIERMIKDGDITVEEHEWDNILFGKLFEPTPSAHALKTVE